ncbi:MAG: ABC transporter permease subunit [Spirochaetes bacterium]|nr:ABC transporter permease subunit [Spirochaetota bacterium]
MNRPAYTKHSPWRFALQATTLCLAILLLLTSAFILYRLGSSAGRLAGLQTGKSASLFAQPVGRHVLVQGALTSLLAFAPGILLAIYLSSYAGKAIKKNAQNLLHYLSRLPVLVLGLPLLLPEWAATLQTASGSNSAAISLGALLFVPLLGHQTARIIGALPSGLGQVSTTLGVSRRYAITHMLIPMAAPAITLASLVLILRAAGEFFLITALFRLPSVVGPATVALPAGLTTITILAAALLWVTLLNGLTELLLKVLHHAGK